MSNRRLIYSPLDTDLWSECQKKAEHKYHSRVFDYLYAAGVLFFASGVVGTDIFLWRHIHQSCQFFQGTSDLWAFFLSANIGLWFVARSAITPFRKSTQEDDMTDEVQALTVSLYRQSGGQFAKWPGALAGKAGAVALWRELQEKGWVIPFCETQTDRVETEGGDADKGL